MAEEKTYYSDFLIIGGGIAGLSAALEVSHSGKVILLTKGKTGESATEYAQGGIAAAVDEEKDSPFLGRILFADATRSSQRCISLESLFKALNQPGMFVVKKKVAYGPLWAGDNFKTLKRCIHVLKGWFNILKGD